MARNNAGKLLVERICPPNLISAATLPCKMKRSLSTTSQRQNGQYARTDLQIARSCTKISLIIQWRKSEMVLKMSTTCPDTRWLAQRHWWLPQWRRDPAWLVPFSVAVAVLPGQSTSVFCTFLQYFTHAVINWTQFRQIWMPQLRSDKFWSCFLKRLDDSTHEHFNFHKVV